MTQNRAGELRTIGLIDLVVRVGAVAAALPYGIVAVAYAYAGGTILVGIVRLIVAGRSGPVTIRDQLSALVPSIPLTIGAAVGCTLAVLGARAVPLAPPVKAIVILGGGGGLALVSGLVFRSSRGALFELAAGFGVMGIFRRSARLLRMAH